MFKRRRSAIFKSMVFLLLVALVQTTGLTSLAIGPAKNTEDVKTKTYIIGLKKSNDVDSFIHKKGLSNSKHKKQKNSNILIADLNESELSNMQADNAIAFLEEDSPVAVMSIGQINKGHLDAIERKKQTQTVPWGIKEIGVEKAIENKVVGKKVRVAVLDTGISGHEDIKIAGGISFVEGSKDYNDDNGHGTHIAGIIAAENNRTGVVGGASASSIFAVKVLDKNGLGTYSKVIQGIEWAIDNEMDIITMSLGGSSDSEAMRTIIKEANKKGLLIIAAAGNSGAEGEGMVYPAAYPEVVSVGAIDRDRQRASFSSTGNELDLVAPGVEILSTTSEGDYGVLSGTSVATPHVTGAAAALWSTNRKMTNKEVKQKLFSSALPLGSADQYGYGVVSLSRALGVDDTQETSSNDNILLSQSSKTLPFEFMNSVGIGKNISTSLRLKKNESKYKNIQLTINELGKKEPVFDRKIEATDGCLDIAGLEPDKKYIFSLTIKEQGNVVESYTGELILSVKESKNADGAGQIITRIGAVEGATIDLDVLRASDTTVTADTDTVSIMTGTRYESENNDSYIYANTIYDDDDVYGIINRSNDIDWYKVQFSSNGNANFWLGNIPSGTDYDLYMYDSNMNQLTYSANGSNNGELISQYPVTAGSWYYIKVISYSGYNASSYYLLRAKNYTNQPSADRYEPNDTMSTAISIGYNETKADANLHAASDVDYFRLSIPISSNVNIALSNIPSGTDYDMTLYNSSGAQIGSSAAGSNNPESIYTTLNNGTYYIKIYSYSGYSASYYRLQTTRSSDPDRYEVNDSIGSVTSIGNNSTISDANIHTGTDKDFYKFTLLSRSNVTLGLSNIAYGADYDLYLSDSSGSEIGYSGASGNNPESISATLDAGMYYVWLDSYGGGFSNIPYQLQVGSAPINNTVVEDYIAESDHPYENNYTGTWTIAKPGATSIRVHFDSIQTESGWDYVRTSAGDQWSGSHADTWSGWVYSDSIDVTLSTDGSVVYDGFVIDRIEYEPGTGSAGGGNDGVDTEPNNTIAQAESISWITTAGGNTGIVGAIGYIGYNGDEDWYKIYLTPGNYSFTLTNNNVSRTSIYGLLPADYDVYIRNSSNVTQISGINRGTATEQNRFYIATAGTYYIQIDGYGSAYSMSTKYKYKLVKGDAAFLMEAYRYQQFPHPFYGREKASRTAAVGTEYHASGVAYTYGEKDSLSDYETKMNQADAHKVTPQDNWNNYSSSYPVPGRYKSEYDAGDQGQANRVGIDCSGLIWRCSAASALQYAIETYDVLNVNATRIYENSTDVSSFSNAKIGDVYVKPGKHVVMISKLGSRESFFKAIHARSVTYSRSVQETDIGAIGSGFLRRSLN